MELEDEVSEGRTEAEKQHWERTLMGEMGGERGRVRREGLRGLLGMGETE